NRSIAGEGEDRRQWHARAAAYCYLDRWLIGHWPTDLAEQGESHRTMSTMMRVRLKADGRIVEILPDGRQRRMERAAGPSGAGGIDGAGQSRLPVLANGAEASDAAYARGVRARTKLTQAEFAARICVPIETVRNWEQGKRSPRGPARALLKVIERAPDL